GVAAFLRSVHGDYAGGHEMPARTADSVRRDLLVDLVHGLFNLASDDAGDAVRRHIAEREMDAALDERFVRLRTEIRGRCLIGLGISEFRILSHDRAVLRPDRIVEREGDGIVPEADDDGEFLVLDTVAVLVRREEVVGELGRLLGALRRRGVEEHAVPAGQRVEPVVQLLPRRLESRRGLRLDRRRGSTQTEGYGAETRQEGAAFRHGVMITGTRAR